MADGSTIFSIAFANMILEKISTFKDDLSESSEEIDRLKMSIDKAAAAQDEGLLLELKRSYNSKVEKYNQNIVEEWFGFFAKRSNFDKKQFYDAPGMEYADKLKDYTRKKKMIKRGRRMWIPAVIMLLLFTFGSFYQFGMRRNWIESTATIESVRLSHEEVRGHFDDFIIRHDFVAVTDTGQGLMALNGWSYTRGSLVAGSIPDFAYEFSAPGEVVVVFYDPAIVYDEQALLFTTEFISLPHILLTDDFQRETAYLLGFFGGLLFTFLVSIPGAVNVLYAYRYAVRKDYMKGFRPRVAA